MRVFITGATGYIGSAVAAALRDRGHEITALVRAESDTKKLREHGAAIVAGDLATLPSLGETTVDQLAASELGALSTRVADDPMVARVKGNPVMVQVIANAVACAVYLPENAVGA